MHKRPLPAFDKHSDQKTEFFMAASHQLKSPVAIVQWCLQSVLEDSALDPANRKMLSRALAQSNAMSSLLSDMLNVFRLMHGSETALVPVDVNHVLDQVVELYKPVAERQHVRLMVGPIETLPHVLADDAYLKQAIINLVDNAIKYSNEKGKVQIEAAYAKGRISISVADSGIGIADVDQGRLFKEFFRTEVAREKTHDGTGLGLTLVRHIAERFGGDITFTSELGKGTTFVLTLPAQK
jgi:two-component system, OmpR family, phosphate regulon sensor histidine kinase PhoR